MPREVRARQGDTVDLICWRELGTTTGMPEQVLEANPGLADYGVTLPPGTKVILPDAPPAAAPPTVSIWD